MEPAGTLVLVHGEKDLRALIASMRPRLDPVTYVWLCLEEGPASARALAGDAVATAREAEGLTLVVPHERAEAVGHASKFPSVRITLEVHSTLEAVGLTATFAAALTDLGISANVVAGFHHNHIFVPLDRAADAMAALERLAASAR